MKKKPIDWQADWKNLAWKPFCKVAFWQKVHKNFWQKVTLPSSKNAFWEKATQKACISDKTESSWWFSLHVCTDIPSATKPKWWRTLWTRCGRLSRSPSGRCVMETTTGTTRESCHYFSVSSQDKEGFGVLQTAGCDVQSQPRILCGASTHLVTGPPCAP